MTSPLPDGVMDLLHGMPLRTVGESVRFKFELCPDDPRMIVSWFAFYLTMFAVWTWPTGVDLPRPNAEPEEDSPATVWGLRDRVSSGRSLAERRGWSPTVCRPAFGLRDW